MGGRSGKGKVIWNIPRLMKMSWKLLTNKNIPGKRKLLLIALSLGYLIWPLDLIPDIPFIGQIDDLGIIFLLLNWFVNTSSRDNTLDDTIEAEYYIEDDEDKV